MSAPNNARLVAELQVVTLGINLVGLDRLPEVMRDGAALAQTQDTATMTDTNTVHGGAVSAAHAAYGSLWCMVTDNPVIHAARNHLLASIGGRGSEGQRAAIKWAGRHVQPPSDSEIAAIDAHPTPQTDTDAREKVVEALADLIAVCAPNIYPQPDKPDSAWAKLERARAILAALKTGDA